MQIEYVRPIKWVQKGPINHDKFAVGQQVFSFLD
jgi:hypothetical protein